MKLIKYPRTFHLPFSKGVASDDKVATNFTSIQGKEVVVTVKMDGENTTFYPNAATHARSVDSGSHESRDWMRRFVAERAWKLPQGWRVCGENLYAQHSLRYHNLHSYFYGFSIWTDHNVCVSWDDTLELFQELEVHPVQELWRGIFDLGHLKQLADTVDTSSMEGFVVRPVDSFNFNAFNLNVFKWVRANHVTTDKHWRHSELVKNGLIK